MVVVAFYEESDIIRGSKKMNLGMLCKPAVEWNKFGYVFGDTETILIHTQALKIVRHDSNILHIIDPYVNYCVSNILM